MILPTVTTGNNIAQLVQSQDYRLNNQGITVPFPAQARDFKVPKLTLETHPAFYSMGSRGTSSAKKQPGYEGSLLSSAKVKKKCSTTSHPLYIFIVYRKTFSFTCIYCEICHQYLENKYMYAATVLKKIYITTQLALLEGTAS